MKKFKKILEGNAFVNPDSGKDRYGNPIKVDPNAAKTDAIDPAKTTTDPVKTTPVKTRTPKAGVPQGDIAKIKEASTNWMVNELYGYSLTKLKAVKAPAAGAGGADPVDAIAKGSKATKHPENLAKLLRNIVNIPDQATLANVRNAVATQQKKDVETFKQEIGEL